MSKSDKTKEVPVKTGDRVIHKIFGPGLVEEVTMSANGRDYHVHVAFDEERKARQSEAYPSRYRKILLSYLTVVDSSTALAQDDNVSDINIAGLEDSGMKVFNFASSKA